MRCLRLIAVAAAAAGLLWLAKGTFFVEPTVGPASGWLVAAGGGRLDDSVILRFLELAGGLDAQVVVIPTASPRDDYDADWRGLRLFRKLGASHLTILHTRDRQVADSEAFVEPIRRASGVWFSGGRQWRLVDSYLDTRTHRELEALLERGGVIGGTSAGATIQASYLVRGAPEGNHIMMAPGYEKGFGFLKNAAVDQHLLKREREYDLVPVIETHPGLLGIGLDEGAAVAVRGNRLEVIGSSHVAIYDAEYINGSEGRAPFYFLSVGDFFDLAARRPETLP